MNYYSLPDAGEIRAGLEDKSLPVYVFESLDSTNTEAKRRILAGENRLLLLSGTQTAGRGRRGKSFFSPAGAGLYMSLAFSPAVQPEMLTGLTAYAAVCTAQAIEKCCGVSCGIKWVNDLYLDGKKVCGILSEAVSDALSGTVKGLIVGIGVNITPHTLPEELRDIVGFLDVPVKREELAAEIANRLLRYTSPDRGYMDEYRRRSVVTGREITYTINGQLKSGTAIAIADSGELLVQCGNGVDRLRAGEITIRIKRQR